MDRLLGIRSSSASSRTLTGGDELSEDDVFWTYDDFPQENDRPLPETTVTNSRRSFAPSSGILAVLQEKRSDYHQVLYPRPILQSRVGPSIPRLPARQDSGKLQQQSAPVRVPLLSMAAERERSKRFMEVDDGDIAEEEMVLPPHEIVARGFGVSPKMTFSVLEGAGRTLKGRDLRQVRNAVFRRTGFLD